MAGSGRRLSEAYGLRIPPLRTRRVNSSPVTAPGRRRGGPRRRRDREAAGVAAFRPARRVGGSGPPSARRSGRPAHGRAPRRRAGREGGVGVRPLRAAPAADPKRARADIRPRACARERPGNSLDRRRRRPRFGGQAAERFTSVRALRRPIIGEVVVEDALRSLGSSSPRPTPPWSQRQPSTRNRLRRGFDRTAPEAADDLRRAFIRGPSIPVEVDVRTGSSRASAPNRSLRDRTRARRFRGMGRTAAGCQLRHSCAEVYCLRDRRIAPHLDHSRSVSSRQQPPRPDDATPLGPYPPAHVG